MKRQRLLSIAAGLAVFSTYSFTASAATQPTQYVVKPGDTYYKIAQALHEPFLVLQRINSPKQALTPGTTLQVAEAYDVKAHDTVWKIAKANGISSTEIISWNALKYPYTIYPQETLWLAARSTNTSATNSNVVNTVKTNVSTPSTAHANVQLSAASSNTRQQITNYAKRFVGTPYRWGGASPSSGFDCSGFVQTVYKHFDISLPRTATEQAKVGAKIGQNQLEQGDLVFFDTTGRPTSHVGIYLGGGEFISATSSHGVAVRSLHNPYYWGPRFTVATNPLV